jgi:hypothetical protein
MGFSGVREIEDFKIGIMVSECYYDGNLEINFGGEYG